MNDAEKLARDKGAVAYRVFAGALWPGRSEQYEFVEILRPNQPGMIFYQYFRKAGGRQLFVVVNDSTSYFTMEQANAWMRQKNVKILGRVRT